jgi:alpha-beta hydrolase superfamily lysophospholipase
MVALPSEYGMDDYEEVYITTSDKVKLHCYFIKQASGMAGSRTNLNKPKRILIYFHANAGNMGHRLPIAYQLMRVLDCAVFMVSYRGYGKSQGSPGEAGMKIDAQAVLDYIVDRHREASLIVYGQSIGGAVAIDLVSKNHSKIDLLIVENTFLSLVRSGSLEKTDSCCDAAIANDPILLSPKVEL